MEKTLDEWQAGWDLLVAKAERRGRLVGACTTSLAVQLYLWDRMSRYPPKPIELDTTQKEE